MMRLGRHDPAQAAQRVRDEVVAASEQLWDVAGQGAQRLGDTSRRTRREARERARLAARGLRGDRPASPWRWIGLGLATGAALGAVAMAAVRRWREPAADAVRETADAVWDKAGPTVAAVRDKAGAAVQKASGNAGEAAEEVRPGTTKANSRRAEAGRARPESSRE